MKSTWGVVLFWGAHVACAPYFACLAKAEDFCGQMATVCKSKLTRKIQSGIPFELMTAVVTDGKIVCRNPVQVKYDLWDEQVSFHSNNTLLLKIPLSGACSKLCVFLHCRGAQAFKGKMHYQILLNPVWEGRIARLKTLVPEGPSDRWMTINWDKVSQTLPSEDVLAEGEDLP